MYGLEYALFFGVPENRVEMLDRGARWAIPFASREEGEAHFREWLATLRRWKNIESPTPIEKVGENWLATFDGIRMELFPRPIEIHIPLEGETFLAFDDTHYRRDFWPGQPKGYETGLDSRVDTSDVRMNLWKLFSEFSVRHGGEFCSRVEVAIEDRASICPDLVYYKAGRKNIYVEGTYYGAAPDMIADVLMASSRATTRGPRREVYRRAGISNWWVLEPLDETIEVYELHSQYELIGKFRLGDTFETPLFPGERVRVDTLFDIRRKSRPDRWIEQSAPKPIPEWIVPSDATVGLECFFNLGHPDRRWEYWDRKAYSVLAFGSNREAIARFDHFLTEICRWEASPRPKIAAIEPDVDLAEVGRFQLTRRGRLVHLDVAVDGAKYRQLLATHASSDAWDWGID